MCGIVGLLIKNERMRPELGRLMLPMFQCMAERGPDSAGVAVFQEPLKKNLRRFSLLAPALDYDWDALAKDFKKQTGLECEIEARANHGVLISPIATEKLNAWLGENRLPLHLLSAGRALDLYKDMGNAAEIAARYRFAELSGSHCIGHTRMATESAVTTDGAHPFTTGPDQCLVHNGSLSNHNALRRELIRQGLSFQTENDTEVAAGYMSWRMREGASLEQTLNASLTALDGFYTFVVGTETGFGVLRDPIACKPAVMAETDRWVAFGTEYRALVDLPGIDIARVWEPTPAKAYLWELN